MRPYANLDGDSGAVAYEVGDSYINVQFRGGATYRYDANSPGAAHVSQMKVLAERGRGLSTYISQHVRNSYARKEI